MWPPSVPVPGHSAGGRGAALQDKARGGGLQEEMRRGEGIQRPQTLSFPAQLLVEGGGPFHPRGSLGMGQCPSDL